MLKGIPKILSPELLKVLCEMGHSDRIVIADGNFPSESMGKDRSDGKFPSAITMRSLCPISHKTFNNSGDKIFGIPFNILISSTNIL